MFKNPTDRKERRTSRDFAAPTRDQATTGRFMRAGDSHGVGFKAPLGKFNATSQGPIPRESKCMSADEVA